jgi:hypothetical protein
MIGLPATRDRPGRGSVAFVSAGMVSGNGGVLGLQPNPKAVQRLAPRLPTLMNFPGAFASTSRHHGGARPRHGPRGAQACQVSARG